MNRKFLLITLLLGVGGLIAYLGWQTALGVQQKQQAQAASEQLPEVLLTGLDSTSYDLKAWVGQQAAVLFFFHPECEHCQNEARALKAYKGEFGATKILWISTQNLTALRAFDATYTLTKDFAGLTVARLSPDVANTTFGLRTFPTVMIYGSEGQLIQKYVGETKMEAILKHLPQS